MRHRLSPWIAAAALVAATAADDVQAQPVEPRLDLLQRSSPATTRGERKLLLGLAAAGPNWWAVGEMGLALRSADGGKTWVQVPLPTAVMLTAVTFADERHGWIVGHDGIVLHTADGGALWNRQFDGNTSNAQMLAALREQVQRAAAVSGGNDAAKRSLELAEDRVGDVEAAIKAGPSRPLMDVAFFDPQHGFVVGAFGQVFETRDGGKAWSYIGQRLSNPEGLHLTAIQRTPSGALFVTAEAGVVFRSDDRGQTWARSSTGYAGYLYGVVASTGNTLVAYGFNGNVFRSTNNGQTWTPGRKVADKSIVHAQRLADSRLLLVGQSGQLLVSSDDGASFAALPKGLKLGRVAKTLIGAQGELLAAGAGGLVLDAASLKDKLP
jgi:photosystem II stability/assembly factor-like uncharacterized protein